MQTNNDTGVRTRRKTRKPTTSRKKRKSSVRRMSAKQVAIRLLETIMTELGYGSIFAQYRMLIEMQLTEEKAQKLLSLFSRICKSMK